MRAFVSYDASDRAWARELRTHLAGVGVEAWIDADELLPGDNSRQRIGNALASSDALLVLVSPASVRSEALRQEVQFALGAERFEHRIIPVILEAADGMPWILNRFPAVSGQPAEVARQVADLLHSTVPAGSSVRAGAR